MNGLAVIKSITDHDIESDESDNNIIWNLYDKGMQFYVVPYNRTSKAKLIYENLHKNKYHIESTDGYCQLCSVTTSHQYCSHNLKTRLCTDCANWVVYDVNTFMVRGYKIIFATMYKLIAIKTDQRILEYQIIPCVFPSGVLRLPILTATITCTICDNQTQNGYASNYPICEKCAKFPLEIRSRIIFKCILLMDALPYDITFLICNYIIDIYDVIFHLNW